jgi:hypothetical protein
VFGWLNTTRDLSLLIEQKWALARDWFRYVLDGHAAILQTLKRMEKTMNEALAALQAKVEETNTVAASAITLLNGLSQQIKDAGTDPVKLAELTAALDASNDALAAAVVANTPASAPAEPPAEEAAPEAPPKDVI